MATSVRPGSVNAEEAAFISDFASRLEAGATAREAGGSAEGKPAASAPAAGAKDKGATSTTSTTKPAAAAKPAASVTDEDTSDEETETEEGTPGSSESESSTGDEETEVEGDDEGSEDTGETAEETDTPNPKADDKAQTDEDEEAPPSDDVSKETREALAKAGLKLQLSDIPEAGRPLVQKKLREVDAAFTRVMMEGREYRKERTQFVSELTFINEHPHLALADLLARKSDGSERSVEERDELVGKVQAELDKLTDPDKARLFATDVKDARAATKKGIEERASAFDEGIKRADRITSYARTAARKLAIPFEPLENAIALKLSQKEGTADLTDAELDAIIDGQARIYRRHIAAHRREATKTAIQDRSKDRRTASPAARMGGGTSAPAPASPKKPTNDKDFVSMMEKKHASR